MERNLAALEEQEFDLAVIGGGIFGACAAWDAATRGLRVALIERGDFGGATSANSFKLIHGGFRYLQHADVARLLQSAWARRAWLRMAPHLVHPLPIIVPTYGHGMKGKEILRVAMRLYEVLTWDRNHGITDPARRVPSGRCLPREEVLQLYPGLDPRGLTGAAVFYDGQMYNPPRLVLAVVRAAAEAGAVVANYVEATGFDLAQGGIRRIQARDGFSGDKLEIRTRAVLNAAGPYAETLLTQLLARSIIPPTPWSRDAYLVVKRRVIPELGALALPARTMDPDAVLCRGRRHLFLAPWRHYTLVGVWHRVYQGLPDHAELREEEIASFLDEINEAYPSACLTADEITMCNAGLIPFGENNGDANHLRFAHSSRVIDHRQTHGIDNLFTLIGARFTTGPYDAVAAVDRVTARLGCPDRRSVIGRYPVYGGAIESVHALEQEAIGRLWPHLPIQVLRALVRNYGAAYVDVLRVFKEQPQVGGPLGASAVLKAEVVHAVRAEMAHTLGDVVFRRTDLGTGEHPSREVLQTCSRLMGQCLGWSEGRILAEVDQVMARFPSTIRIPRGQPDASPIIAETVSASGPD